MATTSQLPHINKMIEQLSVVPENKQGLPNVRMAASGGLTTSVTVDTSGSGVGRDDANLDSAPDDLLNNLQLYWLTGINQGTLVEIEDFTWAAAVATLTVSAMANPPGAGDLFIVLGTLGFSNISLNGTIDPVEREFVTRTLDSAPPLKTNKRWSGSADGEVYGLTTPLGNGVTYAPDRTSQVLSAFGTVRSYAGDTVGVGSTTTNIVLTGGGTFTAGDLVMINGQIRMVENVTPATPSIDLDEPLTAAPAAAVVVYGAEEWTPDNDDQRTLTFCHLIDDQLKEYHGGSVSFKAAADWGGVIKWSLTVSGGNWLPEDAIEFEATEQDKAPIEMLVGESFFDGESLCMNSFEFDQAAEMQEIKDTCAGLAFGHRGRKSTLKCVWRNVDSTPKADWEAYDDLRPIRACFGNEAGRAIAFHGQGMAGDVADTDVNSTMYWDSTFMLRDDFTSLEHTPPKITRF